METLVIANFFVLLIVVGIAIFFGLDLKKWLSWLYGLYGFMSGFSIYFLRPNVFLGLQTGVIIAFVIMYGGAMTRWNRQRSKDAAESWLLRYGQGDHLSLLARIMKKLLNK